MTHATVLWRRLDVPGHDFCRLVSRGEGWELQGTAVFRENGFSCCWRYEVRCDATWHTQSAVLTGWMGAEELQFEIEANDQRRWRLNGVDCPQVEGCLDLDLGITPATNLLPLRRLSLPVGAEGAVTSAWFDPSIMSLAPLRQTYRRIGETRYAYRSIEGDFAAELGTDAAGFVVDYPTLWIAETGP
jgi:hypothetical protein